MVVVAVVILGDDVAGGVFDGDVGVHCERLAFDATVCGDLVRARGEGVGVDGLLCGERYGELLRRCRLCCDDDVDGSRER